MGFNSGFKGLKQEDAFGWHAVKVWTKIRRLVAATQEWIL